MKFKMGFVKLFTLLILFFIVFSCSEDAVTEPEKTLFEIQGENGFVGTVEGTDAFIALLISNKEALVYVCNGEEEIYEWFRGTINNPKNFSLNNSYDSQVTGQFDGEVFTGNVVLYGKGTHSFTAKPNIGNEIGIFQVYGKDAVEEGIDAGWILNSNNEERGSFRFQSVFQSTPTKPKTSTIIFRNNSFSIQKFSSYHPDSISVFR